MAEYDQLVDNHVEGSRREEGSAGNTLMRQPISADAIRPPKEPQLCRSLSKFEARANPRGGQWPAGHPPLVASLKTKHNDPANPEDVAPARKAFDCSANLSPPQSFERRLRRRVIGSWAMVSQPKPAPHRVGHLGCICRHIEEAGHGRRRSEEVEDTSSQAW
jgi:hypothetical protein